MSTPSPLEKFRAPFFLKNLPLWLVWKYLQHKGGAGKPLKMPYYVNGTIRQHSHGSPADIKNLTSFTSATEAAIEGGYTGIGLALLEGYNITALDFDNCVYEDGTVDPEVESAITGTYSEMSPSGKGVRAFVLGNLGNSKSPSTDSQFGFELFNTKGFVTFTGQPTELCRFTDCTNHVSAPNEHLTALINSRFTRIPQTESAPAAEPLGLSEEELSDLVDKLDPDCSYPEWVNAGMALHHETSGSDEGFTLWDSWSANGTKYASGEYNRRKWDSFGSFTSRAVTARTLIRYANSRDGNEVIDFTPIPAPVPQEETSPPAELPERTVNSTSPGSGFFHIRTAEDFVKEIKPVRWLIKGFLPKATLGVFYGESGSGKSFAALDICASLGRQVDWNGIRSQKAGCRVLYVAAEGVGGFAHRLTAYCTQAGIGIDDLPIDIISDVPPNLTDGISVDHLIKDIHASGPYDLIVMDTFAQVTAGANENSGEDMGKALGYCRKIAMSADAMVLLIHHSGKDASKGARGWSGIHAAADAVFEVTRFDNDRTIKVTKQKDGIDGAEYGFGLLPVVVGTDGDGDEITSCIVEYRPVVKRPESSKGTARGGIQNMIVGVMEDHEIEGWISHKNLIELIMEGAQEWGLDKTRIERSLRSMKGKSLNQNEQKEWCLLT